MSRWRPSLPEDAMQGSGEQSAAGLPPHWRDSSGLVRRWVWRAVVPSTQSLAREIAEREGPGILGLADRQDAGRGRRGRRWHSPPGGLWVSLALAPQRPLREWPLLTSLAALALRDTFAQQAGLTTGIKWPNDLTVRGRKIAGILAETVAARHALLGMGVNLALTREQFPAELRAAATSVRIEVGSAPPRSQFLSRLLERLAAWLRIWEGEGPAALAAPLRRASLLLDRRVVIRADLRLDGSEAGSRESAARGSVRGRVVALDPLGGLVLETAEGRRRCVRSGEVAEIDPPLEVMGTPPVRE
ncbi:MAG: biotin--[acetyl-CoA-carboxylase] ligase [Candidatus Eisenbacteria bacterium]|nr:biotin--[acetyl-CoA-carboxylase] ligase [Candidatus Eisenbacteria bacterium]